MLGAAPVAAQSSAEAFFHEAAQQYVDGNVSAARQTVEQGLDVAPSDPRLLALQEKLQQDDGSGGGRSSQQGRQNSQQSDPSEGGEETRGDQSNASEQGSPSRAEGGTPSDRSDQPPGPAPSSSAQSTGEAADQRGRQTGRGHGRANALSRAQAVRLLRALEDQEEKLLREVRVRAGKETTVEKDW